MKKCQIYIHLRCCDLSGLKLQKMGKNVLGRLKKGQKQSKRDILDSENQSKKLMRDIYLYIYMYIQE